MAKILIVEDDALTAGLFRAYAESAGHHVLDCVATADDAIRRASEDEPDVILMDYRLLGERTGAEAAAEIYAFRKKPTIFITGSTEQSTIDDIRAKDHPYAILHKPVTMAEVVGLIEKALADAP